MVANKKQEKNAANRDRDAQKRGRTEKKIHRERNIGIGEEHNIKDKGRDRGRKGRI